MPRRWRGRVVVGHDQCILKENQSPFGGGINLPTLQKLADRGLMYSQWHTTVLCSLTRIVRAAQDT